MQNRINIKFFVVLSLIMITISFKAYSQQKNSDNSTKKEIDSKPVTEYGFRVLASYTHDRGAYTQGLFFHNNQMYETSGQYGESNLRKVNYKNGQLLRILNFESKYFLEGACVIDNKAYILTWRERKGFVYDINDFKYLGEFRIQGEGWGLTTDGKSLIMSDGTSNLYYMNPETFLIDSTKQVKMYGKPLGYINELEYINGDIWANVYGEDYIVIIEKETGHVKGKIDCKNVLPQSLRSYSTDVLNGIAYNPVDRSIYITGKYWPKLYKIAIYRKRR